MDEELVDKVFRLIRSHSLSKKFKILEFKYNTTKYEFTVCNLFQKNWLKQLEKPTQKVFYYNFEDSSKKIYNKKELKMYIKKPKVADTVSSYINKENSNTDENLQNTSPQQKLHRNFLLQTSTQSVVSHEKNVSNKLPCELVNDCSVQEKSEQSEGYHNTAQQQKLSEKVAIENSSHSSVSNGKKVASETSSDDSSSDEDNVNSIMKKRKKSLLFQQNNSAKLKQICDTLTTFIPKEIKTVSRTKPRLNKTLPCRSYETRKRKSVYKNSDSDTDYEPEYISRKPKVRRRSAKSGEGSTCHQCRQKTLVPKTWCEKCRTLKGQFCGKCLLNRYGETISQSKQPDWSCPVCKGVCNCSFCRAKKGKRPTGQMVSIARRKGYDSVKTLLEEKGL